MYEKLDFNAYLKNGLDSLVNREFKINAGGKLEPVGVSGARMIPWIFVNHDARKKFCWFWNSVCTKRFKIIPTHCRFACWKIVIKPHNIKEVFDCYDRMIKLNFPGKIGMDLRDYTHGAWAGFIYTDSVEEGRRQYKIVRQEIPNNIPVILKRGCTEMEQLQSSDKWDNVPDEHVEVERRLNDLFSFQERHFVQSAWHKHEIKERWIKHAIKIGDPKAKEVVEKYSSDPNIWNRLVVNSVTYHEEKEKK